MQPPIGYAARRLKIFLAKVELNKVVFPMRVTPSGVGVDCAVSEDALRPKPPCGFRCQADNDAVYAAHHSSPSRVRGR